jgi:hypothetical protein
VTCAHDTWFLIRNHRTKNHVSSGIRRLDSHRRQIPYRAILHELEKFGEMLCTYLLHDTHAERQSKNEILCHSCELLDRLKLSARTYVVQSAELDWEDKPNYLGLELDW